MAETFEITGAKELQVLAGDLAKVPVAARAQLRARMRAVGTPMAAAVRRNAVNIPAKGETSTGLRRAIAAATKVSTKITPETVSVKVYVDPSAMPEGQAKLPALMESSGWTHEVFGRKDTTFQRGHEYFGPAVVPFLPVMRDAVDSALAEAMRAV